MSDFRVDEEAIAAISAHSLRLDSMVEFSLFEIEFRPPVFAAVPSVPRGRSRS
jgi:hypothetical protein